MVPRGGWWFFSGRSRSRLAIHRLEHEGNAEREAVEQTESPAGKLRIDGAKVKVNRVRRRNRIEEHHAGIPKLELHGFPGVPQEVEAAFQTRANGGEIAR